MVKENEIISKTLRGYLLALSASLAHCGAMGPVSIDSPVQFILEFLVGEVH